MLLSSDQIIEKAWRLGIVIPAFNIPYLPMMEPVIRAVRDTDSFALIETARIEWIKLDAKGPREVFEAFKAHEDPDHVRLHLDHLPVVDEDENQVDWLPTWKEVLELGYHSVMIDASRLPLEENIRITGEAVALAHAASVPCEAELGAVMGHEKGPLPPYEELFRTGKGFTDVEEARRFVRETRCDWLSVAVGSIHGAVAGVMQDKEKIEARLNLEHLERLQEAAGIPLVLHGGTGIRRENLLEAAKRGIAKLNVAHEIRYCWQVTMQEKNDEAAAQEAVYERTKWFIREHLGNEGIRAAVTEAEVAS